MTKLKPKCLEGTQAPALTSTGILLPCCWLDNVVCHDDEEIKKLFDNKTIDEVNTVDEIIEGDIFQNFIKLLKNKDKNVPKQCYVKCSNSVNESVSRRKTILND
tara:strand:+ start:880 stop:1191 length:312 start_codon:yes stop_codon:yes gene_type:complete